MCIVAQMHLERSCELAEACGLDGARAAAFEDLAVAHALSDFFDDAWDALIAALATWERQGDLDGTERVAACI